MLRPTTDRTRPRARHRWARGAFLRLEVLALVVVAICLAVLSSSSTPARANLELTSGPGDSLTLSNDKEVAAILSLGGMRPGDSVADTVTLGNTGTVPGDLSLSTSNLLDTPGAGGGALSGALDLAIRDVTNVGSPVTVYSGKIDALTPVALGTLAAGASQVYEFRVSFPDAGAGAENAFQGSAVSVEFDWTAVNNDADDVQAPTKPSSFSGSRSNGHLVLKWKAATDNGVVSAYLVYANGKVVRTLGASARSVDMGRFKSSDSRSFQVAARDSAGNVGAKTRTLVIVPSVANLLVSQAKARLGGRGLRAGALSYAYSATIGAGRVISSRSGVVFKGAAIGLTVSRGPSARYSSAIPTGTSGGTGSSGTNYGGTTYGGTPTPSPSSSGSGPTQSGSDVGSPAPSESGDSGGVGQVEPQSFTPADDDTTSPLRRLLGLALLGGAFVAAGGVALRARRPRLTPPVQGSGTFEPLLFWDERLLHAVTSSVRRFTGR